jgi:hypothetical protein
MASSDLKSALDLSSAVEAFWQYHHTFKRTLTYPLCDAIASESNADVSHFRIDRGLLDEATSRLLQCQRLLELAIPLQLEFLESIVDFEGQPLRSVQVTGLCRPENGGGDGVMFTECFYFMAFRFREVVRSLPGFESFEAVGVRDVRNRLLTHPKELYTNSFRFDLERGAILRSERQTHESTSVTDGGLVANVKQFRKAILLSAQRYLAGPSAYEPLTKRRTQGKARSRRPNEVG